METESSLGLTLPLTKENFKKTIFMDKVSTVGTMVENSRETTTKTSWKVTASSPGKTVVGTKAVIKVTRNGDTVLSNGLMVENILVHGKMENSMEKDSTMTETEARRKGHGRMERELIGSRVHHSEIEK